MARWRSSFWRGRPARELTRSEPLDVVSRLFKASLAGALTSLSLVLCLARRAVCECVSEWLAGGARFGVAVLLES